MSTNPLPPLLRRSPLTAPIVVALVLAGCGGGGGSGSRTGLASFDGSASGDGTTAVGPTDDAGASISGTLTMPAAGGGGRAVVVVACPDSQLRCDDDEGMRLVHVDSGATRAPYVISGLRPGQDYVVFGFRPVDEAERLDDADWFGAYADSRNELIAVTAPDSGIDFSLSVRTPDGGGAGLDDVGRSLSGTWYGTGTDSVNAGVTSITLTFDRAVGGALSGTLQATGSYGGYATLSGSYTAASTIFLSGIDTSGSGPIQIQASVISGVMQGWLTTSDVIDFGAQVTYAFTLQRGF